MPIQEIEWQPLRDYDGHEVSEYGDVRNIRKQTLLRTSVNQSGARYVSIRNTTLKKYENKSVGHLVALAFNLPRDISNGEDTILHKDANPENCAVGNIMWSTRWHAMAYHQEIGRMANVREYRKTKMIKDQNGTVYQNPLQAALATGCLPSSIDYSVRYNEALGDNPHVNFVHRTAPGGWIFHLV